MLETFNQDRGTGKTTKVIELLKEDFEALLIVPFSNMKTIYPKEIHTRILSADNVSNGGLRGRRFSKVILDEGFLYNKEKLAHLYYLLGYDRIETIAIGTV
jgi:hypothetical protein